MKFSLEYVIIEHYQTDKVKTTKCFLKIELCSRKTHQDSCEPTYPELQMTP